MSLIHKYVKLLQFPRHDRSYLTTHQTKIAKRLTLVNFSGPFITHGIELFSPPSDPTTLLIYAINHLPNPFHTLSNSTIPSARSQLELFTHTLGTDHATHLRSIWHPLIRTPNDIYALSSQTIYVTNDHHYRSGPLRGIEDVGFDLTPWSNIIHISLSALSTSDPSSGLTATIALPSIQNPNGLGHGKSDSEILINRAASGILELASTSITHPPSLNLTSRIQLPSTLDNPTYYHDPYSKLTGYSSSGYVLAGLARASKFPDPSHQDPVVVWLVQPDGVDGEGEVKYVQKKIFQDDGRRISTASTAVLVGIDPEGNKGMKQVCCILSWVTVFQTCLGRVSCRFHNGKADIETPRIGLVVRDRTNVEERGVHED